MVQKNDEVNFELRTHLGDENVKEISNDKSMNQKKRMGKNVYTVNVKKLRPEVAESFTAVINEHNSDTPLIGQEPWPEDVKLYQPYETEQILLPDNASCLAVQAFLKMCQLDFTIEYKANAEYMSPSGRVPFIKCGAFLVSELDPIINFVSNKGISLTSHLDGSDKSDMRAYMSLVNTVLGNAENYITWVEPTTYNQVTKVRYGSVHPFPLNHILTYMKRQSIIKKLSALSWYHKTIDQVYDEVDQCCQALSERLEKQKFFFGDRPTELDALVFAHVFTVLTTPLPNNQFAATIRGYPNLIDHCKQIEQKYFNFYN